MLRHKHIDRICIFTCVAAILLATLFMNGHALGIETKTSEAAYASKLFDDSTVHTLDIVVDEKDWADIIENATAKEYISCNLVIDGEAYRNVAIRTKGNSSLSMVSGMDSDRYSFKVEFDHYDNNTSYHGLDKLSLNNTIQDTTYLKDYLSYHMMNEMGIAAPLSSFVQITVNGEEFGLYLAVEGVEEALVKRYYGRTDGKLYKPDNMQHDSNRNSDNSASLLYTDDEFSSYNTIWDGAIFDINDLDKERLIESLRKLNAGEDLESAVDVEAVLRYFVAHNFVLNFDSYTGTMNHNYYLYEQDGRISMIPWDYNLAFGSFGGMGRGTDTQTQTVTDLVNFPIDSPLNGASMEDRPLLGKLFEQEEYLALYHQYFDEFISGYFESGKFEREFDRVTALIDSYVQNDPTAFYSYDEFVTGAENLKQFCLLRAESIRGQLDGDIPSTSEGQTEDSSSFVDGSSVTLSSIGSMGGGGNRGFRQQAAQPAAEGVAAPDGNAALGDLVRPAITQNEADNQDPQGGPTQNDDATTAPEPPEQGQEDQPPDNAAGEPPAEGFPGGEFPTEGFPGGEFPAEGFAGGGPGGNREGGNWQRGGMPGMPGQTQQEEPAVTATTLYLVAASVIVLALGTVFVLRYKRF